MATYNEKWGWEWTAQEREERKLKLRKLQSSESKIEEQARRINLHLPEFAKSASDACRAVSKALAPLKGLDIRNGGRKYQPISPEEADRIIGAAQTILKPWTDFISSPDYVAAVRVTNRNIRSVNAQVRERNRAAAEAYNTVARKMDDVLRLVDQGDIAGALDKAATEGFL